MKDIGETQSLTFEHGSPGFIGPFHWDCSVIGSASAAVFLFQNARCSSNISRKIRRNISGAQRNFVEQSTNVVLSRLALQACLLVEHRPHIPPPVKRNRNLTTRIPTCTPVMTVVEYIARGSPHSIIYWCSAITPCPTVTSSRGICYASIERFHNGDSEGKKTSYSNLYFEHDLHPILTSYYCCV